MKIICIGRNYAEHAKELDNPLPKEPVIFLKPKSALVRSGNAINYPEFTDNLQYECEIVLRICKNGKKIPYKAARHYFDQWTVGIDFTARDVQSRLKSQGLPWELSKAFDDSAVVGQFRPVPEKPYNTRFSLMLNEETVQQGNTADMIFSFEQIISYASQYFTLQIGDLVFTGTPSGVGAVLPYDVLEGFIEDEKLLAIELK